MVNVYDVSASDLIDEVKEELKKNQHIKPPEWAAFAKSGTHKERPPYQADFWYIRGAALLRKIYTKGPVGTSRLRIEYGGRKHRGIKPEEFRKGSGAVIRKLLQQLEKAGYIRQTKKGRIITPSGQKFLDNTAYKLFKSPKPKKVEKLKIFAAPERAAATEKRKKEEKIEEIPLVEQVKKQK